MFWVHLMKRGRVISLNWTEWKDYVMQKQINQWLAKKLHRIFSLGASGASASVPAASQAERTGNDWAANLFENAVSQRLRPTKKTQPNETIL